MKLYTKKLIFALAFCLSMISAKAQSVAFYTENFTAPVGFSSTGEWLTDIGTIPSSSTYPGASGGNYMIASNGTSGIAETLTLDNSISTLAYTNITVQWGGYKDPAFPAPVTFSWSADGVVWNAQTFTDVPANSTFTTQTNVIALPAGAAGIANLRLRWQYTSNATANYYAIDDIVISGTIIKYFNKTTGNLNVLGTWGTNADGTGTAPSNFTSNDITYNITNNAAPTIGAAWTVSGTNSKVITGNGAFATNFTIPAGFALTGTIDVTNSATLTIANTTIPTFGTLGSNSTVNYAAAGAQTVTSGGITYGNLTISGSGAKAYIGNMTVSGVLNISAGTLNMPSSGVRILTLNGTITGAGTITGSTSRLTIGGTAGGAFGTLLFTAGSQTIHTLTTNRTGAGGSVTLGSNLVVATNYNHQNGTLNLNGFLLTINSTLGTTFPASGLGSFSGSKTSSITINGSGAFTNSLLMSQTSATTRAMGDVTLNRNAQTLTLGNAMEVWGSLTPTDGTFAAGSNLTLKSDAGNKGRIGIIGASGALTGNPTVEVFAAAGLTGWTNICSAGVTGKAMSDWNTSFVITCPTCPDGSVVGNTPFTSIYTYSEAAVTNSAAAAAHYIELQNITTAITPTTGYWVFLGNGLPNTTNITIPLTGVVQTGNLASMPLSLTGTAGIENGWNLVANPYPSPITVSSLTNTNTDATVYVYNPDTDASVPFTGAGIVPMGQAFAIRALAAGATLTPVETWKTATASNQNILKPAASPYYFDDFLLNLTSTTITKNFFTQAYFMFDNTATTTGFDNGKDAYFFDGSSDPGTPKMVSITNNEKFIRNAQPLSGTISIPVAVYTGTTGVFTISPDNLNKLPAGACVKLYDIANNITHDLKTGPYTATITANTMASTPRFELKITLNPGGTAVTTSANPFCKNDNSGLITAKGTSVGPWNYVWKDAANTIIKTTLNSSTADSLKNLNPGTYKVDVNTVGTCDNADNTFTLTAAAPLPISNFTVNNDTVYLGNQFIFTNTSSNAASFLWSYGDGNTSTNASPTYSYANVGDYNVNLLALSACNDSSNYAFQVHVTNTATLSGINTYANNNNSIKIGSDNNGVYVQLNYEKNVKATVTVTNALGQMLITPKAIEGATERFYIDINTKDQLLFITVSTGENRVTERIFSSQ